MKRIRYLLKQGFTVIAVMLLSGMTPAPVFADTLPPQTADPSNTQQTVTPPNNGPTGSDAHTFSYNAKTGLWENNYYTYDPATQTETPKAPLQYSCNPDTLKWDTTVWQYVASHDDYEQVPMHLSVLPAGAIVTQDCPAPVPVPTQTATPTTDQSLASDTPSTLAPTNTLSNSNDDSNSSNNSNSNDSTPNNSNNTSATLNATVASNATSGNALAAGNDDVGNVSSGNAAATANIINMLQSQAAFASPGVNTFTANIQGDVQGDFVIDPATLGQPAAVNPTTLSNAKINNVTNGTINNDITLNATSGDATARNNDDVASVSTGDASAIANVINMINSVVAANQSFIGTINIYGNYTGNILMPVDSLNALLASAGSDPTTSSHTTVNNTDNMAINNNVNLGATSGTALAKNNDDVGSVTTGNAMTNLTILNLTGKQVIAANSLLVFVNVMGNWVGLIMDAPAGTTSAALGGSLAGNTTLADNTGITNTGNYAINNNITANAATGNATAVNNDDVGSVATGNALAGVSLANLINSNFSLSNWFGVLFINVFGTWHGNFGVMKPPVVPPITSGSATGGVGGNNVMGSAKVFAFVPSVTGAGTSTTQNSMKLAPLNITGTSNPGTGNGSGTSTLAAATTAVLGASHSLKPHVDAPTIAAASFSYWTVILLTVGSAGLGFVAFERVRSNLRSRYISK